MCEHVPATPGMEIQGNLGESPVCQCTGLLTRHTAFGQDQDTLNYAGHHASDKPL